MTKTADTVEPAAGASPGSTPSAAADDTSASPDQSQPTAGASGAEGAAHTEATPAETTVTDDDEALLTDAEFEKLQDDPAALRKSLQAAFTQKTQKLGPARQLLKALSENPDQVILAMAKARGLEVKPGGTPSAAVDNVADEIHKTFSEAFGGDEAGKQVVTAIDKMLEQRLQPLRQAHDAQMAKAVAENAKLVEDKFTKLRPDWKQHEPKMMELAKLITPAKGMDPVEYLDLLYVGVANDTAAAKKAQGLVDRITKSAAAAAESKVSNAGAPSTTVNNAPPKLPTIRQAAEAAARGERFD